MTAPIRPDTTLPNIPRVLSPDEFDHAQMLSPSSLSAAQYPAVPPTYAPRDATRVGDEAPNSGTQIPTGLAHILTQFIDDPIMGHPAATAATGQAPGADPAAGLMGRDIFDYSERSHLDLAKEQAGKIGAATLQGVADIGRGLASVVQHPIDTWLGLKPLAEAAMDAGIQSAADLNVLTTAAQHALFTAAAGGPEGFARANKILVANGLQPLPDSPSSDQIKDAAIRLGGIAASVAIGTTPAATLGGRAGVGAAAGATFGATSAPSGATIEDRIRAAAQNAVFGAVASAIAPIEGAPAGSAGPGAGGMEIPATIPAAPETVRAPSGPKATVRPDVADMEIPTNVRPRMSETIRAHADAVADAWQTIFAPATRTPEAAESAQILRATTGHMAAQYEQAAFKLDQFRRSIDPLPEADKLGFIDAIEGGRSQPSPEFNRAAVAMRRALDDTRDAIRNLGTGKLENFIENYFPHIWEDPERAATAFRSSLDEARATAGTKRPMEGSKSFLKQRTIPTTLDGLKMGLKPVTTNPIDLTLLKLREMQRYLMAHQSLNEMKAADLIQYVRAGERAPDGYVRINDKVATVFGPPHGGVELPKDALTPGEAPPPIEIRNAAGNLRDSLKKVPDDALQEEWSRLAELNANEEGVHGAIEDSAYRSDYLDLPTTERLGRKGQEDLPDADGTVDPERLAADNKSEAGYRKNQIIRAAREKAMQRIESEMASRPSATDFNFGANEYRKTGKLPEGLRPMKPEDVRVFGQRIMGEHWAPEPVARVINNYLSPGLRGNALYDAYRGLGNLLNQAQLGFSAFHLMFTSMDASVSRNALGLEYAATGRPITGLAKMLSSPAAPVTNMLLGRKVRAAYLSPETASPDMAALANAVKEAGGRIRMDSFYKNSAPARMVKAWRAGEYGRATALSVPALLEGAAKPIMEHIVPLQKLGVFGDLAKKVLADLPPDATLSERRAALGSAWDSVDNRMGQLVYDNLFWSKTFKDMAMASVRSVGWNIGTIRELGGGLLDVATEGAKAAQGKPAALTHRAAYVMALPVTVGFYGAVYQYLRTGEGPQEMKDYFYPRTGEVDADGNPERVQIASYMKDFFAYHAHPWETVKHKVSPALSTIFEMLQNENYYGDQIRNPDDPAVKQIAQEAEYVAQQVLPFSLRNMMESSSRGDRSTATKLGNWFGITPAPREEVRSDAQNQMVKYIKQRGTSGGATPEQADARDTRRSILAALRGNADGHNTEALTAAVTDAIERHELTPPDVIKLLKRAGSTPAQEKFRTLTLDQALDVYKRSTPAEQALFAELLLKKVERKLSIQSTQ